MLAFCVFAFGLFFAVFSGCNEHYRPARTNTQTVTTP